jgi:DNA replication and repair protein RecF
VGLLITRLGVEGYRSYDRFELRPDAQLTLVVGPNAVGKTNLIEAVQLLTAAESFRRPQWADLVRWGGERALLCLEAEGDGRHLAIELSISKAGRREYRINGKVRRRFADVIGILPSVLFTPDDLRLVKDSPERRRAALDALGGQLSPSYAQLRAEYERVLRQRNALLKEDAAKEAELAPWTERLVEMGARFTQARERLFGRLGVAMAEAYDGIADDGPLETRYVPSWKRDGLVLGETESIEDVMKRHLRSKRQDEKTRRTSLAGPHRDEIEFRLGGANARTFASQGQQRTIALAWKAGEVTVATSVSGQPPILLLDDVMSELDERRRHALASFVGTAAQTIMTTANIGYFEEGLVARSKVVYLS